MTLTAPTFFAVTTTVLIIVLFVKRKEIQQYIGHNFYLYCWAALLCSNLGLPAAFQISCRFLCVCLTWLCFATVGSWKITLKKSTVAILLCANLLLCFISVTVSVAFFQSLFKCCELLTDLILIWQIYSLEKPYDFVRKTLTVTMYTLFTLVLITCVGFFLCPSEFANFGRSASKSLLGMRLAGGLLGANKASALGFLCILWAVFRKGRLHYSAFILIISLIVMFYSQSRATLILLPILVFLKLFQKKNRFKWLYFSVICLGIFFVLLKFDLLLKYFLRGQTAENFASFTGRSTMWRASIPFVFDRPVLGYGFGAGGELVAKELFNVGTMHSAIFETLLGTGILGLIALLIQYIYAGFQIVKKILRYGVGNCIFEIIIFMFFTVRSITSLGIGNWHSPELLVWYFFLFALECDICIQHIYSNIMESRSQHE